MISENQNSEVDVFDDFYKQLELVGKDKPLSYFPLDEKQEYKGVRSVEMVRLATDRGLWSKIYTAEESHIGKGAVFVSDIASLRELLEKNSVLLAKYKWPVDPVGFIEITLKETAPGKYPLFDLVADAYGDYTNPDRTDMVEIES